MSTARPIGEVTTLVAYVLTVDVRVELNFDRSVAVTCFENELASMSSPPASVMCTVNFPSCTDSAEA